MKRSLKADTIDSNSNVNNSYIKFNNVYLIIYKYINKMKFKLLNDKIEF